MIVVTLIDYDARIIPDSITLPGVAVGILASLVTPVTFLDALIGAALGFFLLLAIAWGYEKVTGVEGMGGGDIKLAALLGAFLGWQGLVVTIFLASLGGTLVGGLLMVVGRGGRKTALPFGTFLAPVAVIVYIWGSEILSWYARLARS
jgi:leader peptidase (prepilin peptidase)/N-methyltransferase